MTILGVSGPDGAGKSGLVDRLRASLEADGATVATTYLFGCVLCRRLPPAAGRTVLLASRSSRSAGLPRVLAHFLEAAHGLADAAELAIRLGLATATLEIPRRGRKGNGNGERHRDRNGARGAGRREGRFAERFLITDRSPLDGMAKHLGRSPAALGVYRRLARRYRTIFLLGAPPEVLVERDREHAVSFLADALARFDEAARLLPNVVRIETAPRSPETVLQEARRASDRWEDRRPASAAAGQAGGDGADVDHPSTS